MMDLFMSCQLLVDYCDVFISCLDFHSNTLDGPRVRKYPAQKYEIFIFGWTISLIPSPLSWLLPQIG